MNEIEQLKADIIKLQAKYQVCVSRRVYIIGKQIRDKQTQLATILNQSK